MNGSVPSISMAALKDGNSLSAILDALPVFIGVVNKEQKYEFVNATYEKFYQRPKEEIVGLTVEELNGRAQYLKSKEKIEAALRGQPIEFEFQNQDQWYLINYWPRHQGGEVTGYFVITSNVTALKEMTTELKQSQSELQKALAQFETLSNHAHEERIASLGIMASGLAHEISQPLTAINGLLFVLRESLVDEQQLALASVIDTIEKHTTYAIELIERLRRFVSRRDKLRQTADVNEIVRDSITLVGSKLREKMVDIELELGSDLPSVEVDPVEIQQVVVNLVVNATESMCDQPGSTRMIQLWTSMDGNNIVIRVSDNGPGIPESMHGKIFDAFETSKETGLGIGLAISRALIERHYGELKLLKTPDIRGATFEVILPIKDEHGPGIEAPTDLNNGLV